MSLNISLDQLQFKKEGANSGGTPESVLYSTLTVAGVRMHVEAYEVDGAPRDPQATNPAYAEAVEALKVLSGTNELRAMEIEGRKYVLGMYPPEA